MIPYNIELTDEEERILDEIWGVTSQQASGPDAADEGRQPPTPQPQPPRTNAPPRRRRHQPPTP
jgi:hypothetical protein